MRKEKIIEHLKNLSFKYEMEINFLLELKKTPTNFLHQNEIDINIVFYKTQIEEIEELIKELEQF